MMINKYVLSIDYNNPDIDIVKKTASVLASGGIVAAPTETRYGLLVRADKSETIEKLYAIKKRPLNMPASVFVSSIKSINKLAYITNQSEALASAFLPGSLTLVLKSKTEMPAPVVVKGKIGIRLSPAPFINQLLNEINFLVTATSANLSGMKDCKAIDEIYEYFKSDVDLYIDAGNLENETSTVVDLTGEKYKILRHGAITEEMIEQAL